MKQIFIDMFTYFEEKGIKNNTAEHWCEYLVTHEKDEWMRTQLINMYWNYKKEQMEYERKEDNDPYIKLS